VDGQALIHAESSTVSLVRIVAKNTKIHVSAKELFCADGRTDGLCYFNGGHTELVIVKKLIIFLTSASEKAIEQSETGKILFENRTF
jgi:hypothetical protein